MEGQWFVIQVMSGQEKKVKKNLEESRSSAGMIDIVQEIVVPTENVAEVKRGEQKISEKRLWPGYALVKMILTDDSWMYVKETNGVIDFLGGGKPVPLSTSEVGEILQDLQSRKGEVAYKHKLQVGENVKIIDGVFVNFIGTVIEVNHEKGRLSAMVSIFGRDTRVDDLEFWQVEEVTEDVGVE
ncbi:MAG: transcription termination/antitermination protein NusG [Simkaniaceae bacterium]|nr:MAG: transcription termination/antitermination protein NusG [Simkaniaceae bacterium]